jgi:hypothetical protein
MKSRIFTIASLVSALAFSAAAQTTGHPQWDGVWQSQLDGQTGAILTLAEDAGALGGTLVLNMVVKDGGPSRVAFSEPHVLVNPRVEGNTLSFDVRRAKAPAVLANFTVTLTPEGKARIHCTNCGSDAPTVDMERSW